MQAKNMVIRERALGMWLKGMTFRAIAKEMGVSFQWVHKMLCPSLTLRKATYDLAGGKCQECGVHLGSNGHYHSEPTGLIDDFTQPLTLLCVSCHSKAHKGGDA